MNGSTGSATRGSERTAAESKASLQPRRSSPEWMVVIRAYGSILYATRRWGGKEGQSSVPLEPRHLDEWMKDCAERGVTTVLWRANCAGTLTYPSRFTALAGEPPLPKAYPLGDRIVNQGWRADDWPFLGDQCRRFNTLEVAVQAAHRYALRFYLDFSTFDSVGVWCTSDQWPAGGDRAFDPDLWLWSKDQTQRLAGIPCYADPRVRRRRVEEIAEALAYGIDGVLLGFFSHCDGLSGDRPCWFGYNPMVVEEYKRRYGVDPLTESVDPHRFYALHGECFTEFVREASRAVRAGGKKLLCTARTDGVHGWDGQAAGAVMNGVLEGRDLRTATTALPFTAGFHLEWERWAREDLVDGLVLFAPFDDGMAAAQAMRAQARKPVYLLRKYSAWDGQLRAPQSLDGFRREIQAVRNGTLDGYVLHLLFIVKHAAMNPDWRDLF